MNGARHRYLSDASVSGDSKALAVLLDEHACRYHFLEEELPQRVLDSLTNSFYLRTYPAQLPSTLIVVGWSQRRVDAEFTSCRLAGHNGNSLGVHNEESDDNPDIFVCGPPRKGWPEFWRTNQRFS